MKIEAITVRSVRVPYRRNHTLSFGPQSYASSTIVTLHTDAGIDGYGEANVLGGPFWSYESTASIEAICTHYLAPAITGMDPRSPALVGDVMRRAVNGNPFARAAVEMACFDIAGKAAGVPVNRLLGGARRDSVDMIWSLADGDPQKEVDEAIDIHETHGIGIFKVKTGHKPPEEDLARLKILSDALGDRFQLRPDANQGWDEMTCMRMMPALRDMGIYLLEQPVPRDNLAGMTRLRAMGILPIMADEAAMSPEDVSNIIRVGGADIFALKVAKAGGILPTLQSAQIAAAAGLQCYMGCMMETGLGVSAYLHACAAAPDMRYGAALPGPLLMTTSILKDEITYRDGKVLVPDGPGLGVTPDWDVIGDLAPVYDA
ncbi:muconate/chloromuconate family cycloisomerase [Salipiger mucosus]|uniref:Muconate cycloisomerase n=1 Tax=Salipiger mucosus DSM 16094 TaxID=1123237 RepID=S9Q753_9RHOB|nr:muconate/chloromuconate family cycloisomerase [Salipiger mucosus]EPX75867.1 Muconate cycloisomerase [Salipiger mucosus DSM 16094]